MAQCFNENTYRGHDGLTNLERFMRNISTYCDALVLYDDASTDSSVQYVEDKWIPWVVRDEGQLRDILIIRGEHNDFKNELAHKQRALEKCLSINPDVILWLDIDECINDLGPLYSEIRRMWDENLDGLVMYEDNLWRTDRFKRVDGLWAQGQFCRVWKASSCKNFQVGRGLHQRLYPFGIDRVLDSSVRVTHYGFASDDSILRKYRMYKAHGQSGAALTRLIDESTLKVSPSCLRYVYGPGREVFNTPLVKKV
jgi:hypothetical protein